MKLKIILFFSFLMLFNFSFAGTLTFNDDSYVMDNVNGNYVINSDFTNYTLTYQNDYYHTGKYCYMLTILDDNSVNNELSVFGLGEYSGDSNLPEIFALQEVSANNYTQVSSLSAVRFFFCTDGSIYYSNKLGFNSFSNFPYTVTSEEFANFVASSNYSVSDNVPFNILYSFLDVYEYDESNHILGDLVYGSSELPSYPVMNNPFTSSELNVLCNKLLDSSDLSSYLPSNYKDYFIIYNQDTDEYRALFYPDYAIVSGHVFEADENNDVFYRLNFLNQNYLASGFNVYVFKLSSDTFSCLGYMQWSQNTIDNDFYNELFNFNTMPVVYSSRDFVFYYLNSSGELDYDSNFNVLNASFTISGGVVSDLVTGEERILNIEKTSRNIFDILGGFFGGFWNNLKSLIVPDVDLFNQIKSLIDIKLPIISQAKTFFENIIDICSDEALSPPVVTIHLGNVDNNISSIDYGGDVVALDFSWYAPYKSMVDIVIIGFVYAVFWIRLFKRLPHILSGSDNYSDIITSAVVSERNSKKEPIGFRKE